MIRNRSRIIATILAGVITGGFVVAAPAHADRSWTRSGCTMLSVNPNLVQGTPKKITARTTVNCTYTQPSIQVSAQLQQYRGLGYWATKKGNSITRYDTKLAYVAAIWTCSGGNQLYRTQSGASMESFSFGGGPETYRSHEVRLTC